MYDSPDLLQNICIDFVSELRNSVFSPIRDVNGNIVKYEFKDSSLLLPACLSEALLEALDKKTLRDRELSLFANSCTRLSRVLIRDASLLSPKALRVLKPHNITELTTMGLSTASVNDLIGCLGEWTMKNLQLLNVSGGTFGGSEKVRVVIALSKLKNLKSLDVSFTELTSQGLQMVEVPRLERLSLAGTAVADVGPVSRWAHCLRALDLGNLRLTGNLQTLEGLRRLQHLDISTESEPSENLPAKLLTMLSGLPELVSLDLSGRKGVDALSLRDFLSNHRQMQFLGLMENQLCQDGAFCRESDPMFNPNLVVTGFASETQVLTSLRRYLRRKVFVQKSLCYLYTDIQNVTEVRVDIIELVLRSMEQYPGVLGVQIAGTACLYNLSKGRLSYRTHPALLRRLAAATLDAMARFPSQLRLQKNALLTLCSDRMLQDVSLDRYRCAELAMNSLINFDDPAMNRMTVAICSILASRISTVETSNLGAKTDYMIRLLDIVKSKAELGENDIMMKFTLSTLWNLTDESPRTCVVFLDQGGLQLFLDVLNKFAGESSVETKVLGLMNNLAEVSLLRDDLMKNNLIDTLRKLLHSEHIDVSYFAAGIVAHLASEGEAFWALWHHDNWAQMVHELGQAVSRWGLPPTEMVAYRSQFDRTARVVMHNLRPANPQYAARELIRSFKPFYPLFYYFQAFQVQLWAAWAVHHVCYKNPKRYCQMLVEEEGVQVLRELLGNPAFHADVAALCTDILRFCDQL